VAVDNPAGVPVVGPGAPYITPLTLTAAPTGISWSSIPAMGATAAQQLAEQLNICVRATAMIDSFCNQPLRATVDVEELTGPGDFRCQNQPTGVTRLLLSRSPVLSVVSGQVSSAAAFPRSWQTIAANQFEVEQALIGVYGTTAPGSSGGGGQAVLLAPGWVTWLFGRLSSRVQVTYINGWPHAALTGAAAAGASTLTVDDITGWTGAAGNISDSAFQEFVSVTAVTPTTSGAISGPGTLTLSSALVYGHDKGTLVSTLPASVVQAAIYLCVGQALTRGATATTVQAISGGSTGGGTATQTSYADMAKALIAPFKRVI
jgi:hypothetical protein